MEEANRQLEDEQERLESTFRRRIDQLRERSEREQRELDDDRRRHPHRTTGSERRLGPDPLQHHQRPPRRRRRPTATSPSARPTTSKTSPRSRKSWDRELQTLREDLTAKARSIEEISIVPTQKNIEVTKYLILWAAGLP